MDSGTITIIVIIGALFVLILGLWLISAIFIGAVVLLQFAAAQGFLGLAAYIAMWVFLFPVMLVVCAIVGLITWIIDRRAERDADKQARLHSP